MSKERWSAVIQPPLPIYPDLWCYLLPSILSSQLGSYVWLFIHNDSHSLLWKKIRVILRYPLPSPSFNSQACFCCLSCPTCYGMAMLECDLWLETSAVSMICLACELRRVCLSAASPLYTIFVNLPYPCFPLQFSFFASLLRGTATQRKQNLHQLPSLPLPPASCMQRRGSPSSHPVLQVPYQ